MAQLPNFKTMAEHYKGLAIEFRKFKNMDSAEIYNRLRGHTDDINELQKTVRAIKHNTEARIRNALVTTDVGVLHPLVDVKTNEPIQGFPATLGDLLGLTDRPLIICLKALGVVIPPEYDPDSKIGGPLNQDILTGYRRDLAKLVGVLRRETKVVEEF